MKADNSFETTGHNRTIKLTEIPLGKHCRLEEMSITIAYVDDKSGQRLERAVTLDNVVIPAIIKAINEAGGK